MGKQLCKKFACRYPNYVCAIFSLSKTELILWTLHGHFIATLHNVYIGQ